jgi:hypothetical protein
MLLSLKSKYLLHLVFLVRLLVLLVPPFHLLIFLRRRYLRVHRWRWSQDLLRLLLLQVLLPVATFLLPLHPPLLMLSFLLPSSFLHSCYIHSYHPPAHNSHALYSHTNGLSLVRCTPLRLFLMRCDLVVRCDFVVHCLTCSTHRDLRLLRLLPDVLHLELRRRCRKLRRLCPRHPRSNRDTFLRHRLASPCQQLPDFLVRCDLFVRCLHHLRCPYLLCLVAHRFAYCQ